MFLRVCLLFFFLLLIGINLLTLLVFFITWADGKRAKAPASLVRPLNWFLFLPTLVALRMVRVMLSLVSICLGFNEIEGSTMVTFLHESRRTIRQILVEGKRNKHRSSTIDYAKQSILSFLFNLSTFVSQTPTNATTIVQNNKTSVIVNTVHELLVQCYMHEWANRLTYLFYFIFFLRLS